jgi:thioredoxin-like negative regulator of GroEL
MPHLLRCRPAAALVLGSLSLALVPLSLLLPGPPRAAAQEAVADEVKWRSDYNAARREAQEKGKPLVIDFGTEHCFWCKRLDATTFRDPAVVKTMNDGFIPLRVDAEKEATLANLLHIQSYPTIVIGAPDGKILMTREGYLEADRFLEQLQRVLAVVSNPEWMTRDYQEAVKAIAGSDYARAIALLRSVTEDGKERPVQVKSRQLLKDLEQQAAGRLARARQLSDKGQSSEAIDTLTELLRVFSGTQAAADAGQMLTALGTRQEVKARQRARRARELLAQAREDYRTQQYVCCMDRCEVLSASYGDLPEGEEARLLLREIKSNPDWIQNACENLSDRLGSLYLDLADSWLKKGQPRQAVLCLERVVKSFPSSRQAEIAQVRLAQIQGRQPTQQTNFKK